MKLELKGEDPNYLASVVKIGEIKKHPNADKLSIVTIFGNDIIIANGAYTTGEVVIYFPIECCISPKFLSWGNLYEDKSLNVDENVRGYFQSSGRVKAINLRQHPSQGFIVSADKIAEFIGEKNTFKVGDSFDTVNGLRLVEKYIRPEARIRNGNDGEKKKKIPQWVVSSVNYFPRPIRKVALGIARTIYNVQDKNDKIKERIVPGQFAFHYSTPQLGKSIYALDPKAYITASIKCHGTSACYSNLLWKKKYEGFYKFLNKIGIKTESTEYRFTYSSRSVLKNRRDGKWTNDLWGKHGEELFKENAIEPGISLYGEILGWSGPNSNIQKNYDYGVRRGESEFWVYRITHTSKDGIVYEFTWDEIEKYCDEHDLMTVPVYYKGPANELFDDIPLDDTFHEKFLERLKEKYLDKTCELCTTGVVNEGIVLKDNSKDSRPVYKFKSPKFLIRESTARDNNEEDIEELS